MKQTDSVKETFSLGGRRALVTGSARGIGRAIARALAECGATVAVHGVRASDALDQSLADARAEAQKMIDNTKAAQSALAAELRAKADVELSALRDRAMKDIDAALKAAVAEIYNETALLASNVAAKILKREINAGDQNRLVEESLGEMQALRN